MTVKNPAARLYGTYLLNHPEERDLLLRKADLIAGLRDGLDREHYVEVATPVLCYDRESAPIPQFSTTNPLTGESFHLRHSAEEHLRRLAVTLDRVYDLGKAIRAEREDDWRTVEFLMLQTSARNVDLLAGVSLVIGLIQHTVHTAYGELTTPGVDWTQISVRPVDEAIAEALQADGPLTGDELAAQARRWLTVNGHRIGDSDWEVMEDFMKHAVESRATTPTVLTGFPYALRHNSRVDPETRRAQRFSLIVGGIECCDGGVKLRTADDYRPMADTNIKLREELFGIPADAGPVDFYADIDAAPADVFTFGLGVDRLLALCAGRTVHDVLTFPFH
ncbi:amino acid--tRNA ligase-related protein [Streptacidiphilus fuscans]|uniref:Aminoacyl-transfer RNA synthetases class-II family profile domain-containing protein n=1 Tax=Streptacidiphilus fuscans TaxID=2789292 RepID=A0A931FEK3_9ACTN|nr:amino acid--tRNA ligase-related protein [Streptacidiphilus fuscans]MBF9071867.1 hypothetical protein [Streptacidiphilus fuscans]